MASKFTLEVKKTCLDVNGLQAKYNYIAVDLLSYETHLLT